jgi:hypothetical protein
MKKTIVHPPLGSAFVRSWAFAFRIAGTLNRFAPAQKP